MSSKKLPPSVRALDSFGISGLLSSQARIFHQVFYDASGLGRAADLVAARLRESGPDEFSLHALVLFGVLGASRAFEMLSPIHFECGMDSSHFGLSFAFELQDGSGMSWDDLVPRVTSGVAISPLDELLISFCRNSDYVVLKGQPGIHKVEICALVAWGRRQSRDIAPLELVVFAGEPKAAPDAAEYTALGDLDYSQLLKLHPENQEAVAPVTGEVLAHSAHDAEEMIQRIRSKRLSLEDQTLIRVSSGPLADTDESKIVLAGSRVDADSGQEPSAPQVEVQPEDKRGVFSKILRWVGPSEPEENHAPSVEIQSTDSPAKKTEEVKSASSEAPSASGELSTVARELERSIADGALAKVAREAASVQSEVKNPRVERWIESLMAELNAERSRIMDASKRLTTSVRAKELEFKNRENALQQHLRERDESIRTKTVAMMRMKDQIAKLQISLERAKMSNSSTDETAQKYKYNQSQKLLQAVRAESEAMKFRIEELQTKLAQAAEFRKQSVPLAVHSELERQLEKQTRQLEDLKRQRSSSTPDEVRKNLEIAQRVAMQQKQKNEQLELVLQEQKLELERLKQELERVRARSGSDSGGNAA